MVIWSLDELHMQCMTFVKWDEGGILTLQIDHLIFV